MTSDTFATGRSTPDRSATSGTRGISGNTSGNKVCIEDLWKTHYVSVVQSAQRILRRRDVAEEIAQQAFVVFIERSCAPAPGKEGAYLRRMASNLALTHLRRQGLEELQYSTRPPLSTSAEDEAMRRVHSEQVRHSIGQLSQQQRTVIVYRHVAGYSGRETADSLGISTGSVKTHASRARSALRTTLKEAA